MTTSAEFAAPTLHLSASMSTSPSRGLRTSVVRQALATQIWQTLILPNEVGNNLSLRSDHVAYVRFDAPHKSIPDPCMLTHWTEDIGWHRPLTAMKTAEQFLGRVVKRGANRGATVELQLPNSAPSDQALANFQESSALGKSRLTQLLAEAAHDIRAPIAVAQQILHALSQRVRDGAPLTEAESKLLSQASLRLTQANQWAEGILLERSLEHGQPVNVRRRFYPSQWRLGIEPLLQSLAAQRRVQLQWHGWDRSLPRVYLDPTHLSRIILNLVTNALQASPPNSCVKLHVAWLTHITQQLVLTLEDQGSGLPPYRLRQVNSSAMWPIDSPESLGDGLGLRTAKMLARGLGGSLAAQASHAGGTQFTVSLPVDNYHSLIRAWLRQNAELAQGERRWQPQSITIHAVRSSWGASATEYTDNAQTLLTQIDSRFQQTADVNDLVYRVAKDRWLWLSLRPEPKTPRGRVADQSPTPSAAPTTLEESLAWVRQLGQPRGETIVCRHQQVFRLDDVLLANWLGTHSSQHNLLSVTAELAEKIAESIGDHIPPVDELTAPQLLDIPRPAMRGTARQTRIDSAQGLTPPFSAGSPRAGAILADTPCDAFSGTLAELSQQWHIHQRQLEKVNKALGVRD